MNKKQRNRKLVTQNKRNRMINRRYTSTIKTLSKLFLTKVKTEKTIEESEKGNFKLETKNLVNKMLRSSYQNLGNNETKKVANQISNKINK